MSTQPENKTSITYLKDYTPPAYLIPNVQLDFDLYEDKVIVNSRLTVQKAPPTAPGTPLELNGEQLRLLDLKVNGMELTGTTYQITADKLILNKPPEEFTLEITTEIWPQNNKAFSGLYKTKSIFCTQMEAQGFRRVTYFLDRPDVLSVYTTSIRADERQYPFLLSNGELVNKRSMGGGRHRVEWKDPFPKPCYLFALVAGDLGVVKDRYTTSSGRNVALEIYTDKGNESKCAHAMESLKQSMKWDESTYGLEYDLNTYMIVAVDDFNMGAMENKGLNIFNTKYVLGDQKSATDIEFLGIQTVIGHEYFHNWSGNRVTCRDWFQLSLKEGLTVFRDQEFTSDLHSRAVKRIDDVTGLRTRQFPEDASGMAHPVRPPSYMTIDNFYTRTVYDKGAEVIRMLQTLLGRAAFLRGAAEYFKRFDGQAVTTDDFVQVHQDVSGKDLTQFKRWYDQAGTPQLHVQDTYDAATKNYTLQVRQECVHPVTGEKNLPYHIPFKIGLLDSRGQEIPLQLVDGEMSAPGVLEIREEKSTFVFKNVPERPVLSALREFSAPVQLFYEQTDRDLIFMMEKDTDAFNRFEASQKLYQKVLLKSVDAFTAKKTPAFPAEILEAMKRSLIDPNADRAFLAKLLSPPSVNYVMQFCLPMEPQALELAYDFFHTTVQRELKTELRETYAGLKDGRGAMDAPSVHRRALKAVLLQYITWGAGDDHSAILKHAYDNSRTMTDSMTALCLIAHHSDDNSQQVIDDFFGAWKQDTLVLNKWFTAQALSLRKNTLENVQALTNHPSYDKTNPNKIYALLYMFTASNPFRFHDPEGKAYAFITDMILDIDSRNPQVASRLATSFNDWTRWAPTLRTLAQRQLSRIHSTPNVSKNVFEIVDKALKMSKDKPS